VTEARRVVAVELAAGAGTRFGGGKLTAPLDGRPLAAHAATAALACGIGRLVVVLGADADAVEAALVADGTLPGSGRAGTGGFAVAEAGDAGGDAPAGQAGGACDAPGVVAVRNDAWATGLASSVRRGIRAAAEVAPDAEAALLLLADQPRVLPATVARLLAAGVDEVRPFAVAARPGGGPPNPVLVHRSAWSLAQGLAGDRGFGPLLTARPDLVRSVDEPVPNPDVDTPGDLAAVNDAGPAIDAAASSDRPGVEPRHLHRAEAVWVARVRANDEQSLRVRETPEPEDFYGPVTGVFVADPRRQDDAVLDVLVGLSRPDDRWLDIGAGAGRFALPLALHVREVVALDPSPSMLGALREGMERHGIDNVLAVEGRWPAGDPAVDATQRADVALVAHVGYDVEAIGAFLDAMEAATTRLCVAVLAARVPSWPAGRFWPPVHGEARIELPALGPFVDLLVERGAAPRVTTIRHEPRAWRSRDDLHGWVRHQLFLAEGSQKDRHARELLDAWAVETPGGVILDHQRPVDHGVVAWEPPDR
jgi:CTP:molybdopterin cytidylyltransferase MocA/SAM-dependent methyltransferase